ncbi:inactive polyglycylase TTLL10 [Choloepus didactylus]|uniref:inactive polyglycylase TTLL10 n=1 Tax=Choloepus didactylus TaxID=27675 RepID=UPI00189D6766|nr:inactive polyglycylase TTLL10 [Choloepus didactylus]
MGNSQEEGLLCHLNQLDRDADPTDEADTAGPQATLLEEPLLAGDKQPPSSAPGPFFYIGGTNGASIISSYCRNKGWQRTQDSRQEDYKLKWCEVKSRDSYCTFREGEQLLFQLPNNKLLTTKIGLLSALREHARVAGKISKPSASAQARALKMEDFFPETYRLDIRDEREAFFTLFAETQIWICKPSASNQGKGIFLLRNHEDVAALQAKTQGVEDDPIHRKMPFRAPQARVVQRYIQNPLLLDGKKFDVRSYLLIACAMPYMVFFGHGYARLTLGLYDPQSSDLSGHLTNQFMQKKSPLYVLLKEDTVWSMEHLNCYINDKFRRIKGLPKDWVFTTFTPLHPGRGEMEAACVARGTPRRPLGIQSMFVGRETRTNTNSWSTATTVSSKLKPKQPQEQPPPVQTGEDIRWGVMGEDKCTDSQCTHVQVVAPMHAPVHSEPVAEKREYLPRSTVGVGSLESSRELHWAGQQGREGGDGTQLPRGQEEPPGHPPGPIREANSTNNAGGGHAGPGVLDAATCCSPLLPASQLPSVHPTPAPAVHLPRNNHGVCDPSSATGQAPVDGSSKGS